MVKIICSQIDPKIQLNPNQIPAGLFVETDRLTLKFTWKGKGPRKTKHILKKTIRLGGLTLSY